MNNNYKIKKLVSKGLYDEAIDSAKKYFAKDRGKYLLMKSYVYLKQNKINDALNFSFQAHSIKKTAQSAYSIAYIYYKKSNSLEVQNWLENAINIDPTFEKPYFLISNYYNKRFKHLVTLRYLSIGLKSMPKKRSLKALKFDTLIQIAIIISMLSMLSASVFLLFFNITIIFLIGIFSSIALLLISLFSKLKLKTLANIINQQDV